MYGSGSTGLHRKRSRVRPPICTRIPSRSLQVGQSFSHKVRNPLIVMTLVESLKKVSNPISRKWRPPLTSNPGSRHHLRSNPESLNLRYRIMCRESVFPCIQLLGFCRFLLCLECYSQCMPCVMPTQQTFRILNKWTYKRKQNRTCSKDASFPQRVVLIPW
jgi:hypothetical protein